MLNDNIRKYRKSKQMSQDELAEKLEVTRQSISLWETGQTQPSLDNIVALAKLFDISTDALLTNNVLETVDTDIVESQINKPKSKMKIVLISVVCFVVLAAALVSFLMFKSGMFSFNNDNNVLSKDVSAVEVTDALKTNQTGENNESQASLYVIKYNENDSQSEVSESVQMNSPKKQKTSQTPLNATEDDKTENKSTTSENVQADLTVKQETAKPVLNEIVDNQTNIQAEVTKNGNKNSTHPATDDLKSNTDNTQITETENTDSAADTVENTAEKDIYSYLKNFVIQKGKINGDYCYLSKSADNYGGYSSEDFSLYYWGDTETIEFCLHSVLDETFSINFYLYVPVEHTGEYRYVSSYYFRDTGKPLYEAKGVINAKEFTKNYPLNCNEYIGPADVQNDFMEMSRQGLCDLIDCLENFIVVEKIKYSFVDFGFVNF